MGQRFLTWRGPVGALGVGWGQCGELSLRTCSAKGWLFLCPVVGRDISHGIPRLCRGGRGPESEKAEAKEDGGLGGRRKGLREEDHVFPTKDGL